MNKSKKRKKYEISYYNKKGQVYYTFTIEGESSPDVHTMAYHEKTTNADFTYCYYH